MNQDLTGGTALAALLYQHRAQIEAAWVEAVRGLPGSHYLHLPPAELNTSFTFCLEAICELLRTGSRTKLEAYLAHVSRDRLSQGFDIGEVIEALLLWQEAALPVIYKAPAWSAPQSQQSIAQLAACMRYIAGRFGQLYADAMHRQLNQLAIVEERQRLARELHDSVTQALYSVSLYAEAAARLLVAKKYPAAAGHLRDLRDTAREALAEMRLLIFELRPPVLAEEGLLAALQTRLDTVESRAGLQAELRVEGEGRLSSAVEEELYRIAREALNNVLKHAAARHVTVHLRLDAGATTLEVSDDGRGFDPAGVREKGGLGLGGMAERARRIAGRLSIQSAPGEGSTVRVQLGNEEA